MKITEPADTTVWRDLAPGLTAEQFAQVERMETIPSPWVGDDLAEILLRHTRGCIRDNRRGR